MRERCVHLSRAEGKTRRIPVDRFEQVTGIEGVDFATAAYGRVEFCNVVDLAANSVTGSLTVRRWENVDEQQQAIRADGVARIRADGQRG